MQKFNKNIVSTEISSHVFFYQNLISLVDLKEIAELKAFGKWNCQPEYLSGKTIVCNFNFMLQN